MRRGKKRAMQEQMPDNLSLAEQLAWIQERAAEIDEEEFVAELLAAMKEDDVDREALEAYLATLPEEDRRRLGYVSTPTS